MDIAFKKAEWVKTETKPSDYRPFTAEKVSFKRDRVAGATVSGDIKNPYNKPVDEIAVTALVRDAAGKLLGGRTTFVSGLPSNGSVPFSLTTGEVSGAPTRADVVAIPWGGLPNEWNQLVQP